jgi:glucosyl-3-phosphoglycerate phosphatase
VTDRRFVLVRHGVTDWNREGRWQGQLDPPLSDTGRHEARLVANRLAGDDVLRPVRIVASSLARARETADIIGAATGVAVEPDRRLMELGAGEWEGHTHAELEATDGERYRLWRTSPTYAPPGAEPIPDAVARVREALDEATAGGASPVVLVSHGGTLRLAARVLFELNVDHPPDVDVDNASISVAARMDGASWRLERWNDTLHLLGRIDTHVDEAEGRPLAL